ncbi:MAG: GTPase RsgA [Firmicutes bacterium]|nr:GTPase RsgA [Bacillota bacterium]
MIRKCVGCGIKLQSENENKLGYVKKEKLDSAKYCERCYKMKHYNEVKITALPKDQNQILKSVESKGYFVFYMVDLFNLTSEVIKTYKSIKNPKCMVLSKIDLLPKSFNFNKIVSWLESTYKIKEEIIFLSSVKRVNINKIFKILDEKNMTSCFIMGYTNSGKSTLINAISNLDEINTSMIPNTTLDFINIHVDKYKIIDSPGFISNDNIYTNDDLSLIKKMNVKKYIKPRNYQIKPGCSIIIENKVRVTNLNDINSFTFYLSNLIDLRKVYENNDYLKEYELKTYHVKDNTDIVIKGLGFINVKKECDINIYINNHNLIEFRKSFLGSDI